MTTRPLDLLLMSCWCSCWCHAAWTRSRRHLVRILPQQGRLCRDGTQDHDIWLLFTINTYLIHLWCPCSFIHNQYIFNPTPPSSKSVSEPQSVREKGVAPDWCRTRAAKCLDLMRVGNRDKCSMIRGNRKTRWISAEDLLCVNTKIYHPTKRSGKVFVSLFIWNLFIKVRATAQLSYACWDDEAFYSGGTLSNVPLWSRQGKCY